MRSHGNELVYLGRDSTGVAADTWLGAQAYPNIAFTTQLNYLHAQTNSAAYFGTGVIINCHTFQPGDPAKTNRATRIGASNKA